MKDVISESKGNLHKMDMSLVDDLASFSKNITKKSAIYKASWVGDTFFH